MVKPFTLWTSRCFRLIGSIAVLTLLIVSCTPSTLTTRNLGMVIPTLRSSTDSATAQSVVLAFLDAWKSEDYDTMYSLITSVSRDAISRDDFEGKYRHVAQNLGLDSLEGSVLSVMPGDQTTQVNTRIIYKTSVFGDINREILMNVTREESNWLVQWDDGLVLPELHGGNQLYSEYAGSGRGDIYDRNGATIAAQIDAMAIGVKPAELVKSQEGNLLVALSKLTGRPGDSILRQINENRDADYVPISEVTAQAAQQMSDDLNLLNGLVMTPFKGRFYFDEGVAPQTLGYLLKISPEQLDAYRRKGYSGEERVGVSGLEAWAEPQLAGVRGGSVYVLDPNGNILTRLASTDSKAPEYLHTTLDKDLQIQAQRAMEGFRGAIVVMERDTGRILAMVSSPAYDANLFESQNYNSGILLNSVLNDPENPLLNRVTQGSYPMGSVFKIVTMAAALESGYYRSNTTYDCGYRFTELPGVTLYDWTYTYGKSPSGKIDLIGGLVRSCNPYFWHIGLDMFQKGDANDIVTHAQGFGLGKKTGIKELEEVTGQVLNPNNEGDAVQLAIGQGSMLATPLQVAVMISSIGNGGYLYRPEIVSKFTSPDGAVLYSDTPEVMGRLPERPEIMDVIRKAMRWVVTNEHGTAFSALTGIQVPIYGKTGTASTAEIEPHSWFAGYTDAAKETKKSDITVVVLAENAGEGSMVAAPIFRRIIEIYYYGRPSRLLPWESSLYVRREATPTAAPTSQNSETPPATPVRQTATP
ncbi:MAG: hypothetical protein GYA15_11010 [Leptolinea sp.]|nr:hypothetical protein [Leptolinea sp.]